MAGGTQAVPPETQVDLMLADILGPTRHWVRVGRFMGDPFTSRREEMARYLELSLLLRERALLSAFTSSRRLQPGLSLQAFFLPMDLPGKEALRQLHDYRLAAIRNLGARKTSRLFELAVQHSLGGVRREVRELSPGEELQKIQAVEKENERLRSENAALVGRLTLLQAELKKNVPHLQVYRFGAGAFTLAAVSLLSSWVLSTSIPFHPLFALVTLPTAIGFMIMGYLTRMHTVGPSVDKQS